MDKQLRKKISDSLKLMNEEELREVGWTYFYEIYDGIQIIGNPELTECAVVPPLERMFRENINKKNNTIKDKILISERNLWARENHNVYKRKLKKLKPQIDLSCLL